MTMIGIYGTLFPDRQIALIFAPMYPFSADTGIKALGLLDSIGKKNFVCKLSQIQLYFSTKPFI